MFKQAFIILLLVSLATPAAAEQAQAPQTTPAIQNIMNLKAAHINCVKRAFPPGDTNPATVERAFAACQTEEQAYLSAVAVVMYIPPGFFGANTVDAAMLEARRMVDRHKLLLKRYLLNHAAKRATQ